MGFPVAIVSQNYLPKCTVAYFVLASGLFRPVPEVRLPRQASLRVPADLLSRINLMLAVQSCSQKYFRSRLTQIKSISRTVPTHRGAYRDRHGRGAECGGRGGIGRADVMAGRVSREPSMAR
jgi:hypothetical protein